MRKIYENPQISLRTVAKELKEECDLGVTHETVRQTIHRHKYHSRVARKKLMLPAIMQLTSKNGVLSLSKCKISQKITGIT